MKTQLIIAKQLSGGMRKRIEAKPTANLRNRQKIIWLSITYALLLGSVLYPGLHEGFAGSVILWNCLPLTVGFILVATALRKSKGRLAGSIGFSLTTAVVALFFFGAWLFSPLDREPHSGTTTLAFIYAPLLSLAFGTMVSGLAWLGSRSLGRDLIHSTKTQI